MKKKVIISMVIVTLLGAGFIYKMNKDKQVAVDETDTLSTYTLKAQNISKTIFGDAVVESSDTYIIYSKLSANIMEIYKSKGDRVEVGDTLAIMDTSDLERSLKQAVYQLQLDLDAYNDIKSTGNAASQANYTNTLNTYESNKAIYHTSLKLYDEGIISASELNISKTTMDSSYLVYLSARDNLNTTASGSELYKYELKLEIDQLEIDAIQKIMDAATITAPIAGTLTTSVDDPYRMINNGELLFEIQNLHSLQVISNISEYEINDIKEGQETIITSLGIHDKTYSGVITSVAPSANISGSEVLIEVVIDITDEDKMLRPNFTTNVEIIVASKTNVLVVPYEAILSKDNKYFVIKLVNEEQIMVAVKKGIESELYIEVISKDLKAGDQIVIDDPNVKLSDKDLDMRALKKMDGGKRPAGDKND